MNHRLPDNCCEARPYFAFQRHATRTSTYELRTHRQAMIVVAVVGLIIPLVIILSSVAWGWKHGTLSETEQERYDEAFMEVVRRW